MSNEKIGNFFRRIFVPVARTGLFVVFFWFGALKVFGLSPATPLVQALFERTISFLPFSSFIILFGVLEMIIGVLFLFRGYERAASSILFLHMITTILPLFLVPQATWSGFLVPTLEGQYIIKNLLIISTAIGLIAHRELRGDSLLDRGR
ncbi:MAG: hypothetical protein AAB505_02645 [Patescibacteria group bacterium]